MGSEMCIRDSTDTTAGNKGKDRKKQLGRTRKAALRRYGFLRGMRKEILADKLPKTDRMACGLHIQGKRDKSGNVCGNKRWLTDTEIEKAFILLQNRIFNGAVTISQTLKRSSRRLEVLKAKYREMLENIGTYEEKSLADVILWIAAEEYAQTKGAEDRIIMQTVQEAGRTVEFRADVFRKIVRKITVTETELCFELINGQKIRNI